MTESVWHATFDCFPDPEGQYADQFSCAMVDTWVRIESKFSEKLVMPRVAELLQDEGWLIASKYRHWNNETSKKSKYVEQALLDKFVTFADRVCIEHILKYSDSTRSISPMQQLSEFVEQVRSTGRMYSLYSDQHDQYANGVTPNGDDFLPIWDAKVTIKNWQEDYPDYKLREINIALAKEWILPEVNRAEMLIAIGHRDDELILLHPQMLSEQLPLLQ